MADKEILKLLADENIENTNDYRQLEFRSRGDAHHTKKIIGKLFDLNKVCTVKPHEPQAVSIIFSCACGFII
jgi:hypothetical protein